MLLPTHLRAVMFVLVLVTVIVPWLGVTGGSMMATRDIVGPEAERRAELAGRTVALQVEQALDLGIPLPDLVGMPSFFASMFRESPEVAWMAVTDLEGHVRHLALASGVEASSAPPAGGRVTDGVGAQTLVLALDPGGVEAGRLLVGWRVPPPTMAYNSVVTTLLLVLIGTLALAWEVAQWTWGGTVGAGVAAVEAAIARVRRGDISMAPRLASDDVVGRLGRRLSRLLRLINYRLEELSALSGSVAAAVPEESRGEVRALADAPARGWETALDLAEPVPALRQLSLFRFTVFVLVATLSIHLPGVLIDGGWHDKPAVLWGAGAGLAATLMMIRVTLPAWLPGWMTRRGAVVAGTVLFVLAVQGWPFAWETVPTAAGLLLGFAAGMMVLPVRAAARAEGASSARLGHTGVEASVTGVIVGAAFGGVIDLLRADGLLDVVGAGGVLMATGCLLAVLAPPADTRSTSRAWPNVQETAAVLMRWPLLLLAAGPGAALRLLVATLLIAGVSAAASQLPPDPLSLAAQVVVIAVAWRLGLVAGQAVVSRSRIVPGTLWGVMMVIGVVAIVIPYDTPTAALWGLGFIALFGGAVAPLRIAVAAEVTGLAGHGLGADRVERTIALVEVTATAMAPVLVTLVGEVGVGGLARTLALVVLGAGAVAYPVLGPGGRFLMLGAREGGRS